MKNAIISAARAAWYRAYEPARLRYERRMLSPIDEVWGWADANPLISVIIPTHNRCELLTTRALPSVLNQTYRNIEVLVCAHGCTDGTADYVAPGSLIEVPRRPTYPPTAENHWFAGPVDPLNAGLKAARGGWIARIDDDDVWEPHHLENALRLAQRGNYEFVSAAHETHEGEVDPYVVDGVAIGGCQTWLYRSYLKFMTYNPDCWRKSWNRVNDTDLQDRMVKAGVRMGYLDEVHAKILPRPGETEIGLKAYKADPAKAEAKFAFTAHLHPAATHRN